MQNTTTIDLQELMGVHKAKSPCVGCINEMTDKNICLDIGCRLPQEWNDQYLLNDQERRMAVFQVRNRHDDIGYRVNPGNGRSGRGGSE